MGLKWNPDLGKWTDPDRNETADEAEQEEITVGELDLNNVCWDLATPRPGEDAIDCLVRFSSKSVGTKLAVIKRIEHMQKEAQRSKDQGVEDADPDLLATIVNKLRAMLPPHYTRHVDYQYQLHQRTRPTSRRAASSASSTEDDLSSNQLDDDGVPSGPRIRLPEGARCFWCRTKSMLYCGYSKAAGGEHDIICHRCLRASQRNAEEVEGVCSPVMPPADGVWRKYSSDTRNASGNRIPFWYNWLTRTSVWEKPEAIPEQMIIPLFQDRELWPAVIRAHYLASPNRSTFRSRLNFSFKDMGERPIPAEPSQKDREYLNRHRMKYR